MRDELEDFIRQHRSEFDDKEPSSKAWKNIRASLAFTSTKREWWNSLTLWRVAAIVFLALSVYLLIPKNQAFENEKLVLREFNDVERFYVQQISQKFELIDALQESESLNGFTQDFQQLEAMYMVLKEEMRVRPSKKVKDALILNLLVRINLLNKQLEKLEAEEDKDKET